MTGDALYDELLAIVAKHLSLLIAEPALERTLGRMGLQKCEISSSNLSEVVSSLMSRLRLFLGDAERPQLFVELAMFCDAIAD